MYNAVGIDVSKGKSTVAVLQPGGTVIRKPFDVSHTSQNLNEDRLENQNSLTNKHTCLNLKIAHRCVSLVYNPHFRYIKTQAIFLQLASSQI